MSHASREKNKDKAESKHFVMFGLFLTSLI